MMGPLDSSPWPPGRVGSASSLALRRSLARLSGFGCRGWLPGSIPEYLAPIASTSCFSWSSWEADTTCLVIRNLPTFFMGPRPAATAVSKRVSLKALWRLIFSPPDSQHSALPLSTLKLFYYSSRDSFSLTVCTIKNRDKRCTYCMYN